MTDYQRELMRLMTEWGVPPRARKLLVEQGARDTQALAHARTFADAFVRDDASILVLADGVGVGKTIAACWAMANVDAPKWGARRFRHIAQLVETGLYGGELERAERKQLRDAKFLVVDDIGSENMTDTFQTMFDGLMNQRYESLGATILTTNLTSQQILERYGKRIYDRLRGRGEWYEINHESLRGRPEPS